MKQGHSQLEDAVKEFEEARATARGEISATCKELRTEAGAYTRPLFGSTSALSVG